jgi:hypothetical protein
MQCLTVTQQCKALLTSTRLQLQYITLMQCASALLCTAHRALLTVSETVTCVLQLLQTAAQANAGSSVWSQMVLVCTSLEVTDCGMALLQATLQIMTGTLLHSFLKVAI